jgi:hypothetical protein
VHAPRIPFTFIFRFNAGAPEVHLNHRERQTLTLAAPFRFHQVGQDAFDAGPLARRFQKLTHDARGLCVDMPTALVFNVMRLTSGFPYSCQR